jgi:uncharacterized protein YjbI with pentapeptide repeats
VFRLTQSHLVRSDFVALRSAIAAADVIDASSLEFSPEHIRAIRDLLERDASGHQQFLQWWFEGSQFGEGSDLSGCYFKIRSFQDCVFGNGVSFANSVFTRAIFRRAQFGDDTNFERTKFGVRADFHSARFGARARFSHSQFKSCQFFSAHFGSEASFSNAVFELKARFHGTRFGARAGFTEVSFRSASDFGGAYFGEKLQMAKARFAGQSRFVGATFGPRARLTGWRVQGDLNMRSAHFHGPMSLRGAQISENAIFDFAGFDGSIDMGAVHCGGSAFFGDVAIDAADRFGPLHASEKITFRSAIVRSPCAFSLGASLIDFSDARFLAPLRITASSGDMVMDRLQNDSRLVLTVPQPIGVKSSPPRLVSVRGADLASVVIAGVDVKALRFRGAEGIDGLRIDSGIAFQHAPRGPRTHREVIAEEHVLRAEANPDASWGSPATEHPNALDSSKVGTTELARIYRGLRKAREDSRDAPGAADFYYGEMEMRRLQAREQLGERNGFASRVLHMGTYLLLELYRLFGGYGVRPGRPLLLFVFLAGLGALWIDCGDLIHQVLTGKDSDHPNFAPASFEQCLVFVLRSALLLPTSPGFASSTGAEWIQIAARIFGPLLIGLFAFGLRARVRR